MLPASGKPGRRGTEWRSAHALTVDSHLGRCHLLWGGPISRRRIATDSTSLVLGSAVNGLAAYAFVAVGTRAYGAEVFAPVSVIWTFWALSVAAFTFPVQHWIIRVVEVEGGDASVRRTLPRLAAVAGVVAMLMLAVAFPLRQRLFGTPSLWWPVLVPIVSVGSAVVGYGRGPDGALAASIGVLIVAANFWLAGIILSRSARISLSLYHAAALFGFFLRLGFIMATMFAVAQVFDLDKVALGVSAVISYLVLLSWEALAVANGTERELEWSS